MTTTVTSTAIHPATHMGRVAVAVADLDRSLAFYRDVLGFAVLAQTADHAVLGAGGTPLLELAAAPGARPAPPSATGLYHFAILVPSRADLAAWLLHLAESGYPLDGAADHLVSEALYLSDPDGNGIEVYRDRPRADWPRRDGQIRMATDPLDLQALLDEARAAGRPWAGLPAGTRLGHMHLRVGDLAAARAFYHDVLGFDVMVDLSRFGALFVSAGGYHHHLGLNIWESRGGRAAPPGHAGLRFFTVELPDAEALAAVRDRLAAAGVPFREAAGILEAADPWDTRISFRVAADGAPAPG